MLSYGVFVCFVCCFSVVFKSGGLEWCVFSDCVFVLCFCMVFSFGVLVWCFFVCGVLVQCFRRALFLYVLVYVWCLVWRVLNIVFLFVACLVL